MLIRKSRTIFETAFSAANDPRLADNARYISLDVIAAADILLTDNNLDYGMLK